MRKIALSCLLLSGACILASCGYGKKEVDFEEYQLQVAKLRETCAPYIEEFTIKGAWKDDYYLFTMTSKEHYKDLTDKEKKVCDALGAYDDIYYTAVTKIDDITYYVSNGFKLENKKKDYSIEYDQYGNFARYYSSNPYCDISVNYTYVK